MWKCCRKFHDELLLWVISCTHCCLPLLYMHCEVFGHPVILSKRIRDTVIDTAYSWSMNKILAGCATTGSNRKGKEFGTTKLEDWEGTLRRGWNGEGGLGLQASSFSRLIRLAPRNQFNDSPAVGLKLSTSPASLICSSS